MTLVSPETSALQTVIDFMSGLTRAALGDPDAGWREAAQSQTMDEIADFRKRIEALEAEAARLGLELKRAAPLNQAKLLTELLEALPVMQSEEGRAAIKNAIARRALAAGSDRAAIEHWWTVLRQLGEWDVVLIFRLGKGDLDFPRGVASEGDVVRVIAASDDESLALREFVTRETRQLPTMDALLETNRTKLRLSPRGLRLWNLIRDPEQDAAPGTS